MLETIWKKILRRKTLSVWTLPAFMLLLASLVYRCLFMLKRATSKATVSLKVPVLSIGNITVGGSGKTPLVSFIAGALLNERLRVGIVSSGYGRSSGDAIIGQGYKIASRSASEIGDEVKLLATLHPEAYFSIDRSKAQAALNLTERHELDLVIVDDGFQHYALKRDIEMVSYDAAVERRFLRRFPYGILREPFSALGRADLVIITRSNFSRDISLLKQAIAKFVDPADIYTAQFLVGELVGHDRRMPVKYVEDKSVFLFAGVGNFRALEKQVTAMVSDLDYGLELSDHQIYDDDLLNRIKQHAKRLGSDLILTTGKDWVKLGGFDFGREIYYLSQTIDLDPGEEKLVKQLKQKLALEEKKT